MVVNPSGTFTWVPDYTFHETESYATLRTSGEGVKKRYRHKYAKRNSWSLNFRGLTATDSTAIWSFYNARQGPYQSFTWQHPVTSTSYKVRFTENEFERKQIGYDNYEVSVKIREVF